MSLTARQGGGGGSKALLIEAGTHPAVCIALIDIGLQYNEKYDKSARKVIVQFEITDDQIEINGEMEPRVMSQTYTMSLNERSALYRDLIAWRGKPFTKEELRGFDLHNILGVPCLLTVTHSENEKTGRKYANISGISKAMKGMTITPTLPLVTFDLDEDPLERIDDFPEWIQEKITASETYKERMAENVDEDGLEYEEAPELKDLLDEADGELPF